MRNTRKLSFQRKVGDFMSIKYGKYKNQQIKQMEELGVFVEEIKEKDEIINSFYLLNKQRPEPYDFERLLGRGFHYFGNDDYEAIDEILANITFESNVYLFWSKDIFLVKNPLDLKNLFTFSKCSIEEKGIKRTYLTLNCPVNWFTDGTIIWIENKNLVYYIEQDCGYRILKFKNN